MDTTVGDFIKKLTDHFDPNEPIKVMYWTKADVADQLANYDGNLVPTSAQAEEVMSRFEVSDWAWEQIDNDFTEALNEVFDDFRCEECYGYYNKEHLADIEGTRTCVECGEEPDAPLYSTSNEAGGEPSGD